LRQGVIADVSDDAEDEEPYQVSGKNGQTWWYEVREPPCSYCVVVTASNCLTDPLLQARQIEAAA
jgi:hypothetical protein